MKVKIITAETAQAWSLAYDRATLAKLPKGTGIGIPIEGHGWPTRFALLRHLHGLKRAHRCQLVILDASKSERAELSSAFPGLKFATSEKVEVLDQAEAE